MKGTPSFGKRNKKNPYPMSKMWEKLIQCQEALLCCLWIRKIQKGQDLQLAEQKNLMVTG